MSEQQAVSMRLITELEVFGSKFGVEDPKSGLVGFLPVYETGDHAGVANPGFAILFIKEIKRD